MDSQPKIAQGEVSICTNTDGPHVGLRHVRLQRNTGYLEREVDLPGASVVRLGFWAKVSSFEGSDHARILAGNVSGNLSTVLELNSGHSDDQYHFYDVDVSADADRAGPGLGAPLR